MGMIRYKKFLMKFETIFLRKPFSSLFNFSGVLCNILQTNALDVTFCPAEYQKSKDI
jgi:hypothetical protein